MPLIKFKKGSFTEVYRPVPVKGVYFTLDDAAVLGRRSPVEEDGVMGYNPQPWTRGRL